jgi:hypothetical protein
MTVSISFPKAPQSYALDDPNATVAEATIDDVDVFIYTAAGSYVSRNHFSVSAGDFKPVSGGVNADKYDYDAGTKISTTTGAKLVFVGLNLPSTLASGLENKPVTELTAVAKSFIHTQLATQGSKLPMFSKMSSAAATFVADENDPANNIDVDVERMVAKVTVELSPSLNESAVPGTLDDYTFAINNFNLISFMVQGDSPFKDPNWDSYTAGDFAQAVSTPSTPTTDKYIPVVTTQANIKDLDALYASENTSYNKTKGEITRVTVRASFIPDKILVFKDPQDPSKGIEPSDPVTEGYTDPEPFWSVTPSVAEATSFFYDEDVANAFIAEYVIANPGSTPSKVEYPEGYCYWNIFLNKASTTNQWDVLRNDFYRCTITRVAAIGNPTPDIEDPGTPPDTDTKITTNINVLFWNLPIEADYVLEK